MAGLRLVVLVGRWLLRHVAKSADLDWVAARAAGFLHLRILFAGWIKRALTARPWPHQALVGADHAPSTLDESVARGMAALAVARRRTYVLGRLLPLLTVRRWQARRLTLSDGLWILLRRTANMLRLRDGALRMIMLTVQGRAVASSALRTRRPLLSW